MIQTDLTIENTISAYLTTLEEPLKRVTLQILYTGNNHGKTLSLKLGNMMLTIDYDELKEKVGDVNA